MQQINKTVVKTSKTTVVITRNDLLKLLRDNFIHAPDDADIFVKIPGGGDWSGQNLDIDSTIPIHVEYTEVEES